MVLDQLTEQLGWPNANEIFNPSGPGSKVLVQLAQKKLAKTLEQKTGVIGIRVGVLASDPETTESPIALVCAFPKPVTQKTLLETQRLAWNFSRSLLLITIEPTIIRTWSCCETPISLDRIDDTSDISAQGIDTPEIQPPIRFDATSESVLEQQAAESLSWIELLSGAFFRSHSDRFTREKRADHMLLSNLKEVRRNLQNMELEDGYIHDLLARLIFVQFLFDRKDNNGEAALNSNKLFELYEQSILSKPYATLADILEHYDDTYALFAWLDERFNGDLFPGKSGSSQEKKANWEEEKQFVQPAHIAEIAKFVRGDMQMSDTQLCLWRLYEFDVIPLEFISTIYEEFVSKKTGVGVHYTRDYVVDLMLDQVLPWDSDQWNISLLDPACGSGIFLVRAYQRLIYRWKYAHPEQDISPEILKQLLEQNLFGIDKDPHAVRVASFSLYLAMCDEIAPRHYWNENVRFPLLRNKRIIEGDFFEETILGFRTSEDAGTYDIVIGNPPWGKDTLTEQTVQWTRNYDWEIANNNLGIPFIIKSTYLTKPNGLVCLIQSATVLLSNLSSTAVALRRKIFLHFKKIESVMNFAAFRDSRVQLFKETNTTTCVLTLRNIEPDGDVFWYECPKPLYTGEDAVRILIEDHDVHVIYPHEVIHEPFIWTTLMWGSGRDRDVIRRLNRYPNLEQMKAQGLVQTRRGITPGNKKKRQDELLKKRFIGTAQFSQIDSLYIDAKDLEICDPNIDERESTDLSAFQLPQLLIKLSWTKRQQHFQAKMVQASADIEGVMCSQSIISVHASQTDKNLLEAFCACYNSILATYYLLLTSGPFAFDRPQARMQEIQSVPLPKVSNDHVLERINSLETLDKQVFELFRLQEADVILVEDMIHYTLADFKGTKGQRPGYQPTHRRDTTTSQEEPELQSYCNTFIKVLKATFGHDKSIGAVIFSEPASSKLPMRLVSIYLNNPSLDTVLVESLESQALRQRLQKLHIVSQQTDNPYGIYQRCLRTYDSQPKGVETVLIVNLVKPDQIRYWTRSMALHDADDVAADMMMWATSSSYKVDTQE